MNITEYKELFYFQNLISQKLLKNIKVDFLKPKITVIVYCLDSKFLNKTLNSIQNQQNIDFEIIIIYDNTSNIYLISNYLKLYKNIKFIHNIYHSFSYLDE